MRRLAGTFALTLLLALTARGDDWPQWMGPNRDGVWREKGILAKLPDGGPKVLWKVPVGQGYAGPAVTGGRVYVADFVLPEGGKLPANAFGRDKLAGTERVLCLDAKDGSVVWKHEYPCSYQISYPAGPRCTPAVDGDRVYNVGAMGDLVCLDLKSGKPLWSRNFVKDYKATVPMWGFAGHPLIDGDRLICLVGGPDALAVAFDKKTGKEVWKAGDDREPGYCPPVIYTLGGKRQLIVWSPEAVNSLDPETGKAYWSAPYRGPDGKPFSIRAGMTIPTPRPVGADRLFVSNFYDGSLMLQVTGDPPAAKPVWQGKTNHVTKGKPEVPGATDALHCVMSTPVVKGGHIYGIDSYGELRCIKADTGERVWSTMKAVRGELTPAAGRAKDEPIATGGFGGERWANAFFIENGDRYFLFNEQGDLIIAKLSPKGYEELSRAHVLEPTNKLAGRPVVWMHPAFADKKMFARNDKELVCVSLAE